MLTLLILSSMLLIVIGGYVALRILRPLRSTETGWGRRRDAQLGILAAPLGSLGVGMTGAHHVAGRVCFIGTPAWDYLLGITLPLTMGGIALGALSLGAIRVALLARIMRRSGTFPNPELQALGDRLAVQVGAARSQVLLCAYDRPLALTCGLWRPKIVLSTWMLAHLDQRELEAVLAHEVGHVARRDYLVIWVATVLRDAFFYLPTSWAAYRHLQHEKELACDALAVTTTRRPLALASALAKVWQPSLGAPTIGVAQSLVGAGEAIEGRIERLLVAGASVAGAHPPHSPMRFITVSLGAAAVFGLGTLGAASVPLIRALAGCGHASLLGGLF